MITLKQLDKTFNKRSANAIHVLNHIDLTLPSKGLVVLLGPSGSGKTTLLNVMGGLDKVDQGTIEFNGDTIRKYRSTVWDVIRNQKVGTIFQNYYLLNQETVYENIALTLRMIGLTDQAQINERIEALLKAVNMENYKFRKASQLSGGQQQRIAIARALAKNPDVILADEPTGNLDSKNTLAIMRMIRAIANEKLVVMVTHEERLAAQFANRIIRLRDGQIVGDDTNQPVASFAHILENEIYLKDLKNAELFSEGKANVKLYHDSTLEETLNLSVVVKDNTIYIQLPKRPDQKIVMVDAQSEVTFKDTHAKDAAQNTEDTLPSFDLSALPKPLRSRRRRHVLSPKEATKLAFKKIQETSRSGKLLLAGFALAGALVALAMAFVGAIVLIPDNQTLSMPRHTVSVERRDVDSLADLERLGALPGVLGTTTTQSLNFDLRLPPIFQANVFHRFNAPLVDVALLEPSSLMLGRLPEHAHEVVIDRFLAERLMQEGPLVALNVTRLSLFLNLEINNSRYGLPDFSIVGISDGTGNVLYGDADVARGMMLYEQTLAGGPLMDVTLLTDDITVLTGRLPNASGEMLLPKSAFPPMMDISEFEPFTQTLHNQIFTVVGVYEVADDPFFRQFLITPQDTARMVFEGLDLSQSIFIFTENAAPVLRQLATLDVEGTDVQARLLEQTRAENLRSFSGLFIFTILAIVASSLSFYFIIRSSMIARIYDIGVYRSLGISKWDITKLFVIEGILLTTVSTLIGFVFMSYILMQIQEASRTILEVFRVTPFTLGVGVLFIYAMNLISGLFPVMALLRKTPATINAQYDI